MKQFDDIFRENVEKAFGSYNADHLVDEGWNSFVAGRKGRRRFVSVIPLWAKAASVAIIIGIGAFFAYHIFTRQLRQETITVAPPSVDMEIEATSPVETTEAVSPIIATVSEPVRQARQVESSITVIQEKPAAEMGTPLKENRINQKSVLLPFVAEKRFLTPVDSLNLPAAEALKVFQEEGKPETGEAKPEKGSGKTSFMAGISGLLAQADEAASSAPGVSVGFYLEQKITERISVRPGLALSMHSFGLENKNGITEFNYSVPLNDGTSGRIDSYNGQLNMLAMELPLNIVFKIFDKERSGFYVSAGASTMIYISQQFTGDFVNEYTKQSFNSMTGGITSETRYSTVEVQNNYGAFSRTDLFRLVNLSAGYSFPFSTTGTLIIEPFLQLPLNDLTSLDLRVRYGGISMKVRFGKQDMEK
jgi:hypothetical protein